MNFSKTFRTAFFPHNYTRGLLNILPVISHKDAGSSLIRFSRKTKLVSCYGRFFHRQQFYKQCQAEIGKKNQANAKQNPETELLLFENYSHSSFK